MNRKTASAILLLFAAFAHGQDENKKGQDRGAALKEPAIREELLAMEKEDVEIRNSVIKELGEKSIPFGGSGPISDPAWRCAAGLASANCITAVPIAVST